MNLISEGEEDIYEEKDAVNDGQWPLGDSEILVIFNECSVDFSAPRFIPELDDQDTAGNEENSTNNAEEYVDALVDRGVHHVASKKTDQDDCETDEGATDQHDCMVIAFGKGLVVDAHTCDGQGQFQKFNYAQSA